MRFGGLVHDIKELYRRHEGSAVWIVGSDPSLSEYPAGFLEGKLGITLHLAHVKFPNATYRYSSEYDRSKYLAASDPSYKEKPIIVGWPVYGRSQRETAELFSDFLEVYAHGRRSYPPTGVRGEVDPAFTAWKVRQTKEGKATLWGAHGSCLHTAIYMAVLLGAREINLIGCGHGMFGGGLEHFAAVESVHHATRPGYKSLDNPINSVPLIDQTCALRDACSAAGIAFHWYRQHSNPMNQVMEIDAEWYATLRARAHRKYKMSRRLYWALVKRPYSRIVSRG